MSKLKIVGAVVLAAILAILLVAGWEKFNMWHGSRAAAEAALLTESFDRADQVEALKAKLAKAKVKTEIRVVTRTVPAKTKIGGNDSPRTPSSCKECFEQIILPVSASTKYWRASSPDITREDLSVVILPAYDDAVTAPCRQALAASTKQLANSEPYRPLRLNVEIEAGYGLAGVPGEARLSIETGRRTAVSLGIGVNSNLSTNGELIVNPAITLRVERRLLP